MAEWYIKELSKLTNVTVRTLHHYDKINLLKPSLRRPNGYRLYTEKDLVKLQQILALKFFGFELSQIQTLLKQQIDMETHFHAQSRLLQEKADALVEAKKTLELALDEYKSQKSFPWKKIIDLIEVYQMTQQLERAWVKEIFNSEELKQFANFEKELPTRFTLEEKKNFEETWAHLVSEFQKNLKTDPTSEIGIALAKKCMDHVNLLYGKKYAHLRTKIFEKGWGEGKHLDDYGLTPEIVSWLGKACDAYWQKRIYAILNQVDTNPIKLWNELLDDMYGEDQERRNELYEIAKKDTIISQKAKDWLAKIHR
ncbi:MAG: MerR family transcriptional regulator [Alphaproteobacteria bacterium]|nr:MerR family transcriptional regulator [Alphaproteobacteria bacterium]